MSGSAASTITKTIGETPDIPPDVQIGDIIVARYTSSIWNNQLVWEEWDHAAIISHINPLTVIEATGIKLGEKDGEDIREGVVEYDFAKARIITNLDGKEITGNLWQKENLIKIAWLRPVFPHPLREIDGADIAWTDRATITPEDARARAIAYARAQCGEPFKLSAFQNRDTSATKWDENEWYCSLLAFKAYSKTVTNMYLEAYDPAAGFFVTPEDLADSRRTEIYHLWINEKLTDHPRA